jgi:pyridoxamine 5'-phosphate oxidase
MKKDNPLRELVRLIEEDKTKYPSKFILSTSSITCPAQRAVLAKQIDESGIVFCTNYNSDKARQIDNNPVVSGLFFFEDAEVQVSFVGIASKITKFESDAYFSARSYLSRVISKASRQSHKMSISFPSRVARACLWCLINPDKAPQNWGGYRIEIGSIQVLKMKEFRMHSVKTYVRSGAGWVQTIIEP